MKGRVVVVQGLVILSMFPDIHCCRRYIAEREDELQHPDTNDNRLYFNMSTDTLVFLARTCCLK